MNTQPTDESEFPDDAEYNAPPSASSDPLPVVPVSPSKNQPIFPDRPPFRTRDSAIESEYREAQARQPPMESGPSPAQLNTSSGVATIIFIALLCFVSLLSAVSSHFTFAPWASYARPPVSTQLLIYSSRALLWHIGIPLACVLLTIRALARVFPSLVISFIVLLTGRTMRDWEDSDTSSSTEDTNWRLNGCIHRLLMGFMRGDPMRVFDGFAKWRKEGDGRPKIEEDGEDVEIETLLREDTSDKGIDFVIRLKDKPNEYLRIVVDSADTIGDA